MINNQTHENIVFNLDEAITSSYKAGYYKGCLDMQKGKDLCKVDNSGEDLDYTAGYQEGMKAAWSAAKFMYRLLKDDGKRRAVLGTKGPGFYFNHSTAEDAIAAINKYQSNCSYDNQFKDHKIEVGDEVIFRFKDSDINRCIVLSIDGEWYTLINEKLRSCGTKCVENLEWTGIHFDSIKDGIDSIKSVGKEFW